VSSQKILITVTWSKTSFTWSESSLAFSSFSLSPAMSISADLHLRSASSNCSRTAETSTLNLACWKRKTQVKKTNNYHLIRKSEKLQWLYNVKFTFSTNVKLPVSKYLYKTIVTGELTRMTKTQKTIWEKHNFSPNESKVWLLRFWFKTSNNKWG
jgi:hypothetical protein